MTPGYGNAGADAAIARWKEKATRWVWLPSRTWARVRLPSALSLARSGTLPDELMSVALKFATEGIDTSQLTAESLQQFLAMREAMLTRAIVAVIDPATPASEDPEHPGQPLTAEASETLVTLGPADFYELPAEDQAAIGQLVDRTRVVEQVTHATRTLIAIERGEQMAPPAPEEEEPTAASLASFRGEPEGTDARADSGEVRPAAE